MAHDTVSEYEGHRCSVSPGTWDLGLGGQLVCAVLVLVLVLVSLVLLHTPFASMPQVDLKSPANPRSM